MTPNPTTPPGPTRSGGGAWILAALSGVAVLTYALAYAQVAAQDSGYFAPLTGIKAPEPSELNQFVKDKAAAVALGKALFWDQNLGSDGRTACASCHFQAGADNRVKNQINPGLAHLDPSVGAMFNPTRSGGAGGPNYTLKQGDFPTYLLQNPQDRNSAIVFQTDDVIGSTGVFHAAFNSAGRVSRFGGLLTGALGEKPLLPGQTGVQPVGTLVNGVVNAVAPVVGSLTGVQRDACDLRMDDVFQVHGVYTRRTTGRNAPTTINAAFNHRNFWDGRANNVFNGSSPFGPRDPDAGVWVTTPKGLEKVRVALENSSAASQAVGPVNSDFEMACAGRIFPNVGRRMLTAKALSGQLVAADDSVLASYRPAVLGISTPLPGLSKTYAELIKSAFQDKFWSSGNPVMLGGTAYSQMEANFALFFGLAIQMYESTLVSDQTPLDAYLSGNKAALTDQEKRGMALFAGKGKCLSCHTGPQLTSAATPLAMNQEFVERMKLHDGTAVLYDGGFYNIGVRPTPEDIGLGASDPWGHPLSFSRQYKKKLAGGTMIDRVPVDTCKFSVSPCTTPPANSPDAVDGSFKTPGLRNVELTGPYFHNGSASTLEQVVAFYNRGGNARGPHARNTSGHGPHPSNLAPDIVPLGLTAAEQADLVSFLKRPLTDLRVSYERAPFDHPQLFIPNGHVGNEAGVLGVPGRQAGDTMRELPAIGRGGRSAVLGPLKPFHEGLAP